MYKLMLQVVLLHLTTVTVLCSVGDKSEVYEFCLSNCTLRNCSLTGQKFLENQPVMRRILLWDCVDECKYSCMWFALNWFANTKIRTPQFYGKWPFLRLWGIQEPASTLFSILNGAVHYLQWKKYTRCVSKDTPMYYIYYGYTVVTMNAWLWSTLFHTRDLWFTEIMDYLSALLAVVYSTFILMVRILDPTSIWKLRAAAVACTAFYINHAKYLILIKFDYGYNIKVAVVVGVINLIGWLLWSAWHYSAQKYVWKCAAAAILVNILLSLEVGDFPPIWYIFDAHSLWHFSTIPIHILWYSFAIDDCLYLKRRKFK